VRTWQGLQCGVLCICHVYKERTFVPALSD